MKDYFQWKLPHSKVSLVRIATTFEDLKNAIRAGKWLKIKDILLALILCKLQH